MNRRLFATIGAIAILTLVAGCGDGDTDSTASGGTAASASADAPMPSVTPSMMTAQFGPGCAAVPTDPADAGSFQAVALPR